MPLTNRTAVVAEYRPGGPGVTGEREGVIVAKATFRIGTDGQTSLDGEHPYPLFWLDQPTTLGALPRDDLPPLSDETFQVMVLGTAHARNNVAVTEMRVALTIGDVRRELLVLGDRAWQPQGDTAYVGQPAPFTKMPLTWERAFGGREDVEVDRDLVLEFVDSRNPLGRGFDAVALASTLSRYYSAPPEFPRTSKPRALPNLENPNERVRAASDSPAPVCWAPLPPGSSIQVAHHLQRRLPFSVRSVSLLQAHPDWTIQRPDAGAIVTMEGFSAHGNIRFKLPEVRVIADYTLDGRSGRRELIPQSLVLLPGERRFYITFRRRLIVLAGASTQPSLRLRLAEGWRRQESG